jgi:CarD family transcriptional regulator
VSFKIGDRLVYPNHGVGVVETIQESFVEGSPAPWYQVRFLGSNSRVMVPVGNSERIGLRPLTRLKDVGSVFRALENAMPPQSGDWKGRNKQNIERMRSGRLLDVADVLKDLRCAQILKALSFHEKKMCEHARYLVVSEIAQINGLPECEVATEVEKSLDRAILNRRPVAESAARTADSPAPA